MASGGRRRYRAARTWLRVGADHRVVVRVHRLGPGLAHDYNAMISTEDRETLLPGDTRRIVTLTMADESAVGDLGPGERFELWVRRKIGHGVVSRRVLP